MALSDADYIALIITTIGGDTADALLATNLPLYWEAHADVANLGMRSLLTKIDGIDLLLGATWRQVSFKALDGASVNLSDMFEHLLDLRAAAQAQVDAGALAASAGGAVGQLTTTAPISPPTVWGPDANDPAYRGDAYRSRKRRGEL